MDFGIPPYAELGIQHETADWTNWVRAEALARVDFVGVLATSP